MPKTNTTNRRNLIKTAAAALAGAPLAAAIPGAVLAEGQPTLEGIMYSEQESAMLRRVLDAHRNSKGTDAPPQDESSAFPVQFRESDLQDLNRWITEGATNHEAHGLETLMLTGVLAVVRAERTGKDWRDLRDEYWGHLGYSKGDRSV